MTEELSKTREEKMAKCFGCEARDEALKALRVESNMLRRTLEMTLFVQRNFSDSMRRLSQQVERGQDAAGEGGGPA